MGARVVPVFLALAVLLGPRESGAGARKCPPDSVLVGGTCVDRYEASVWQIPAANVGLVKKLQAGKATAADLAAGGAVQISLASATQTCGGPPFPPEFPASGNWTEPLYAASLSGVLPTACVSWLQAEQACALAGKRLLTSHEWQRAAAGTTDETPPDRTPSCVRRSRPTAPC